MMFGDPDITWPSVRLVLPVSVAYDLLLCPFVVYVVVRFGGYGGWAAAGGRGPESGRPGSRRCRAARRRGGRRPRDRGRCPGHQERA